MTGYLVKLTREVKTGHWAPTCKSDHYYETLMTHYRIRDYCSDSERGVNDAEINNDRKHQNMKTARQSFLGRTHNYVSLPKSELCNCC